MGFRTANWISVDDLATQRLIKDNCRIRDFLSGGWHDSTTMRFDVRACLHAAPVQALHASENRLCRTRGQVFAGTSILFSAELESLLPFVRFFYSVVALFSATCQSCQPNAKHKFPNKSQTPSPWCTTRVVQLLLWKKGCFQCYQIGSGSWKDHHPQHFVCSRKHGSPKSRTPTSEGHRTRITLFLQHVLYYPTWVTDSAIVEHRVCLATIGLLHGRLVTARDSSKEACSRGGKHIVPQFEHRDE